MTHDDLVCSSVARAMLRSAGTEATEDIKFSRHREELCAHRELVAKV